MADERDWEKEMAEIDRLLAKESGKPPAGSPETAAPARPADSARAPVPTPPLSPPARPPQPQPAAPVATRGERLRMWSIALLGPLGAAALAVWPYDTGCGPMLWVYLVGTLAVFGAGIWSMRLAWRLRRGPVLIVGTLTLIASLVLAATQVLPRTGYAARQLYWTCST